MYYFIYSLSSEGFCENDADTEMPSHSRAMHNEQDDADSQEGGGSDSASSSEIGTIYRVGISRFMKLGICLGVYFTTELFSGRP